MPFCGRSVARRAEEIVLQALGAEELQFSPELEFHIFDRLSYWLEPDGLGYSLDSRQAQWHSRRRPSPGGQAPRQGAYHLCPPTDSFSQFRAQAVQIFGSHGLPVRYQHHEAGGPSQQEIELEFGGLLESADRSLWAMYLLKNLAAAEGRVLSFLPKPLYGEAGNGLHLHLRLFSAGRNLFSDQSSYAGLSRLALHFIGGLLTHAPALCAFTNASVSSYRRLGTGCAAPSRIFYGLANRCAALRIPAYATGEDKRLEYRVPDASGNIYYAYAAVALAGLDGVRRALDPQAAGFGPYELQEQGSKDSYPSLPLSLEQALAALERDHDFLCVDGVFSPELIASWIERKGRQAAEFRLYPHPLDFALEAGLRLDLPFNRS